MSKFKNNYVFPGIKITTKRFLAASKTFGQDDLKERILVLMQIALSTDNEYFDTAQKGEHYLECRSSFSDASK